MVCESDVLTVKFLSNQIESLSEISKKNAENANKRWGKKDEAMRPNANKKREEEKREEENREDKEKQRTINLEVFDDFRKKYKGTKNGNETEFDNFCKKHKDWKEVLPDLLNLYECQLNVKESLRASKQYVAQEKNLQTYINQRSWEEEFTATGNTNQQTGESEMDKQFRELGFK